jgi:hypothetical protein
VLDGRRLRKMDLRDDKRLVGQRPNWATMLCSMASPDVILCRKEPW